MWRQQTSCSKQASYHNISQSSPSRLTSFSFCSPYFTFCYVFSTTLFSSSDLISPLSSLFCSSPNLLFASSFLFFPSLISASSPLFSLILLSSARPLFYSPLYYSSSSLLSASPFLGYPSLPSSCLLFSILLLLFSEDDHLKKICRTEMNYQIQEIYTYVSFEKLDLL